MLVRTATYAKRKKYKKIERIKEMVTDFNVVSRENYFKMATSVVNFGMFDSLSIYKMLFMCFLFFTCTR